jgi:hypothetical protein
VLTSLARERSIEISLPTVDGRLRGSGHISSSTTIHILTELMHIAPELLIDRAKNPKFPFEATVPADMFALGCVMNQIYFRQPLADEQTMREFQNNSSKFSNF